MIEIKHQVREKRMEHNSEIQLGGNDIFTRGMLTAHAEE